MKTQTLESLCKYAFKVTEARKLILELFYLPYDVWIKSYCIVCDRNPNGRLNN